MTKQLTDEGARMARFAYYGITTPEDEAEAAIMDLTPAEVIRLAEKVKAQIAYCESEIRRLEAALARLKEYQNGQTNLQP